MLAPGRQFSLTIVDVHADNLRKLYPQILARPDVPPFTQWAAQPQSLYIGRANNQGVRVAASKWANPFAVKDFGLEGCLQRYEHHIRTSGLYEQLQELANHDLGCWCYNNPCPMGEGKHQCHADVLVMLYRERFG